MSERALKIELKINFPVILFTVLLIHALMLGWKKLPDLVKYVPEEPEERTPLRIHDIQDIRTVGARESKLRESVYLSKSNSQAKEINKDRVAKVSNDSRNLSLSDLSPTFKAHPTLKAPTIRPGRRPEMSKGSAIAGIGLKGNEIKKFMQESQGGMEAGGEMVQSFSNSDVAVNLEVPEGVSPDELNKYELMFYGFQRRTAIGYVNSFYKNLDDFQRANPHLEFPLTETKQVMTGRLTYDDKGNIKQIKMIRWSNVQKLQDFFLDVLKDMDTLHNPPHALWEKTGEFSIYFSLVVNG